MTYENSYNPDCDEYVKKKIATIIPHLREEVTLSEDYTLEDLFKIIEADARLFDIIFSSELGHHPISLYIDDIHKEAPPIDQDDNMEFLEVQWCCNCEDYKAQGFGTRDENSIEFYLDFHGWGTWENDANSPYPDGQKGGFAIEYTPLAALKHYPLKLKTKTKIYLCNGEYEKDEDGNMGQKILFEGHRYFSVYDLFASILYEISWGGSPENRDEFFEDVKEDVTDAKERLEAGEEFPSFDELKKELEEKKEK